MASKVIKYTNHEIFAIPVGNSLGLLDDEAVKVLYAPLSEEYTLMGKDEEREIREHIERGADISDSLKEIADDMVSVPDNYAEILSSIPDISKTTKMSLLPNLICNFSCSYCYSAKGRRGTTISWDRAKQALDFFINSDRIPPQHLSLFISGGGEPLVSWNVISRCIEYSKKRCQEQGFTIYISIVTNGSLLTPEIADFLLEHNCSVCVSFEVLKSLQDSQRGSYEKVHNTIIMLSKKGVRVMLNSTITPSSVGLMQEMVKTVGENYPFVAQYTMEPVTSVDLFDSAEKLEIFYDTFYNEYLKSKEIADKNGVPLRFTFDDDFRDVTVRHCPGKFCITPQGEISVCHLVSSPKETRYNDCVYGVVEDSGVKIDKEHFNRLYSVNLFSYERCNDCFAKYCCGGECMTRNAIYPADYMEKVCDFNRRFVRYRLLAKIEEVVKESSGLSLKEYVRE